MAGADTLHGHTALRDSLEGIARGLVCAELVEAFAPEEQANPELFALLAHETWHNRPGSLPALSGAGHPAVLGQITPGANYEALARATWGAARPVDEGDEA